ncbi:hypothetical protein [Sphaerisporangium perillae]|uniref:hypothetical protein n=1 Tax=Sphaerisporangium perillae TaxID=2935860 RepID=UPI00200E73E5|nr:hypothetical protein [Sphaerisporangium perillae]
MTYIDDVLNGRAQVEDLDDYIGVWHTSPVEQPPLHATLGLLWPEYAMWVNDPDAISYVIDARRARKNLFDHLREKKGTDPRAMELWNIAHRLYAQEWRNPEWSPDPK